MPTKDEAASPQGLRIFPGGELVEVGLRDLADGIQSEPALLVMIAAERLRDLGLDVGELPVLDKSYEHALYDAIEVRNPRSAHAEYNALIGRIVSFAQAYSVGS